MMPVYKAWYLNWLIRQQCQMVGILSPESKIQIVQITTLNDSNILKWFSCIKIKPASSCVFVWFAYTNVAQGSSWFELYCVVEKTNIQRKFRLRVFENTFDLCLYYDFQVYVLKGFLRVPTSGALTLVAPLKFFSLLVCLFWLQCDIIMSYY